MGNRWFIFMVTAASLGSGFESHAPDLPTETRSLLSGAGVAHSGALGRHDHGPEGESSARHTVRGVVQVQTTSS